MYKFICICMYIWIHHYGRKKLWWGMKRYGFMFIYLYIYICMYVCIGTYVFCMYVYVHTPLWEKMALVGNEQVRLLVYVIINIHIFAYMHMHIHVYSYTYECVYVCICTYPVMGEKGLRKGEFVCAKIYVYNYALIYMFSYI
jgi:hypothetical protein